MSPHPPSGFSLMTRGPNSPHFPHPEKTSGRDKREKFLKSLRSPSPVSAPSPLDSETVITLDKAGLENIISKRI